MSKISLIYMNILEKQASAL